MTDIRHGGMLAALQVFDNLLSPAHWKRKAREVLAYIPRNRAALREWGRSEGAINACDARLLARAQHFRRLASGQVKPAINMVVGGLGAATEAALKERAAE